MRLIPLIVTRKRLLSARADDIIWKPEDEAVRYIRAGFHRLTDTEWSRLATLKRLGQEVRR